MIETEYFVLGTKEYAECLVESEELGITIDHYILEWCDIGETFPVADETQ